MGECQHGRRNVLAGKLKRAILEAGGSSPPSRQSLQLEAFGIRAGEFREGGHRTTKGCTPVGCGWVKENALTEMLGPRFMQVWTPFKGLIR